MKCEKCGHNFELAVGGMGMSDAPGWYFRYGLAFLLGAIVLYILGLLPWAGLCAIFAVILIGWSFEARSEVLSSQCPRCLHNNPVKPWSL